MSNPSLCGAATKRRSTALRGAKWDYAEAAYRNGDYDLGLSLLDSGDPRHLPLIEKLVDGLSQREKRNARLKLFRRLVTAAVVIIIVGMTASAYIINNKRNEADVQRKLADAQRKVADDQRKVANVERDIAKRERTKAFDAQMLAEEREREADEARTEMQLARDEAKYESYLSMIGLAKARIDGNEFDDARRILTEVQTSSPERSPAWEWRYLWQQANQSRSSLSFGSGVIDLATDDRGKFVLSVGSDGSVHRTGLIDSELDSAPSKFIWQRDDATCVALGGERRWAAIGTQSGDVVLADPVTGQTSRVLSGHRSKVTDAQFLPDGRLLTSSTDRTVALWDPNQEQRLGECWHIAPVVALASRQPESDGPVVMVAAVSDSNSGRVVGWQLDSGNFERLGEFLRHENPIVSVALSQDGILAASGDSGGSVALWRPQDLGKTNFEGAIKNAIARIQNDADEDGDLVSSRLSTSPSLAYWPAHADGVSAIAFDDCNDMLLTGSDDYTINAWSISDHSLQYALRGHGGWVKALAFSADGPGPDQQLVLSGSIDGTLRTWRRPSEQPTLLSTTREINASNEADASERENQLHGGEILAARLNPAGDRLISASRDHTARVLGIDRKTMAFREIAQFDTDDQSSNALSEGTEFLAMSTRLGPFGRRLFIGSADSTIRIWDVEIATQLGSLSGTGLNQAFALSSNGHRLLSGSSKTDAKAILWNVDPRLKHPQELHRLGGHDQAVTAFAMTSDGGILVTGDSAGRILVWDGATGQQSGQPIDLFRGFRINDLAIASDDRSLWVASDAGQLAEIDLRTRLRGRTLDQDGFVTALSLSPRGDYAVTITTNTLKNLFVTTATSWDLSTQKGRRLDQVEAELSESGQSTGSNAQIKSVRFGNSGDQIIISRTGKGGRSGRVSIVRRDDLSAKSFDLPSSIGALETAFLYGQNQLITLNGEAAFRWSVDGKEKIKSYRPQAAVTGACFTSDGKIAATASRSVRLWTTDSGAAIGKLENPHRGGVTSLDVSNRVDHSGYLFVTTGVNEPAARLWSWKDRETGFRPAGELFIEGTTVRIARFAPDGDHIMLAGDDGSIQIQSLDDPSSKFQWDLPENSFATCCAFSNDGHYLAVGHRTNWPG